MGRSYSVLLLHEDQQVRRFRFNPAWVRLFLYIFILLALIAAGGVYLSVTFWKENQAVTAELQNLRRVVQLQKVQLTSLQNMEKILQAHDPDELQALLSSAHHEQGVTVSAPEVDLQSIFKRVDSEICSVKDVQLRKEGDGKLRLEFTLTNDLEGKKTITGFVEASFVTRAGSLAELDLPEEEMSFHIQRFRSFEAVFTLPEGLLLDELYAFRLLVIAEDGKEVFSRAYPLNSVLDS